MKAIGIWMDMKRADLINPIKNEEIITILSHIETFRIHGGSGTRIKGGPQDVVHDSKFLEREKHQFRAYFKRIVANLHDVDKLVVFGPAETGEKFKKELQERYRDIYLKLEGVYTADSMTENQKKAWVRDYFSSIYKN